MGDSHSGGTGATRAGANLGGAEGAAAPPFRLGRDLEWYMILYEPTDSRRRDAHKNIQFAKLLPAFPEI